MSKDFEPTIVYRVPGEHWGPNGTTYEYLGITSVEALNKALSEGWSLTLADAAEAKSLPVYELNAVDIADDDAPPTRKELEAQATKLGLKFDGRTSDAKLLANIELALTNGVDKA